MPALQWRSRLCRYMRHARNRADCSEHPAIVGNDCPRIGGTRIRHGKRKCKCVISTDAEIDADEIPEAMYHQAAIRPCSMAYPQAMPSAPTAIPSKRVSVNRSAKIVADFAPKALRTAISF
jgi:hypothetical protein